MNHGAENDGKWWIQTDAFELDSGLHACKRVVLSEKGDWIDV
jgi:hypothetical protein